MRKIDFQGDQRGSLVPAAMAWKFGDPAPFNVKSLVSIFLKAPSIVEAIQCASGKSVEERERIYRRLITELAAEYDRGASLLVGTDAGSLIRELSLYDPCALQSSIQFYRSVFGNHRFCGPILFVVGELGSSLTDLEFLLAAAENGPRGSLK